MVDFGQVPAIGVGLHLNKEVYLDLQIQILLNILYHYYDNTECVDK